MGRMTELTGCLLVSEFLIRILSPPVYFVCPVSFVCCVSWANPPKFLSVLSVSEHLHLCVLQIYPVMNCYHILCVHSLLFGSVFCNVVKSTCPCFLFRALTLNHPARFCCVWLHSFLKMDSPLWFEHLISSFYPVHLLTRSRLDILSIFLINAKALVGRQPSWIS